MEYLTSDFFENDACRIWKSNNNQTIHLHKKRGGFQQFCWVGRRGLPTGVYRVSFNIKANKHIPAKDDCGLKLHVPHNRFYNYFLPHMKPNEDYYFEHYIHIHNNDLVNIIFDNFDEDLYVELSNLTFYNLKNEVTIIMQGKINSAVNQIDTMRHYLQFGKIIASSYYDTCPTYYWDVDRENIHFIMNDLNGMERELKSSGKFANNRWTDNSFYQLKTTQQALNDTKTFFTVKTRIDTYFSNMGDFLEIMMNNQHKITTLSLYVRGFYRIKYHMSDILFGGVTSKIKDVIRLGLESYRLSSCPEVNVWGPYIMAILGRDVHDCEEYVREMSNLFIVFPLNWNHSYNFKGVKHIKDNPKSTEEYLRHGCDC